MPPSGTPRLRLAIALEAGFPLLVPHLVDHQFFELKNRLRRTHRPARIVNQRHWLDDWNTTQFHASSTLTISPKHACSSCAMRMLHENNSRVCLNVPAALSPTSLAPSLPARAGEFSWLGFFQFPYWDRPCWFTCGSIRRQSWVVPVFGLKSRNSERTYSLPGRTHTLE